MNKKCKKLKKNGNFCIEEEVEKILEERMLVYLSIADHIMDT